MVGSTVDKAESGRTNAPKLRELQEDQQRLKTVQRALWQLAVQRPSCRLQHHVTRSQTASVIANSMKLLKAADTEASLLTDDETMCSLRTLSTTMKVALLELHNLQHVRIYMQ